MDGLFRGLGRQGVERLKWPIGSVACLADHLNDSSDCFRLNQDSCVNLLLQAFQTGCL